LARDPLFIARRRCCPKMAPIVARWS
jgi:hypothetical protein